LRSAARVANGAGGRVRDERYRQIGSPSELARELDRDAVRIAGRGIALRQDGIAEIDVRANRSRRRQFLEMHSWVARYVPGI